ncbi:hypothetical protein CVT26_012370 [Gymnopilus dilepis]|uniref:Uncharacterized protein n=1 Tax=Gymnopilus dilepis TaxID=231916 RepID=A0A409WVL4_9AGAR|nr:hypothetical protein CVT26_012370 [Gymnopilus dilepis]
MSSAHTLASRTFSSECQKTMWKSHAKHCKNLKAVNARDIVIRKCFADFMIKSRELYSSEILRISDNEMALLAYRVFIDVSEASKEPLVQNAFYAVLVWNEDILENPGTARRQDILRLIYCAPVKEEDLLNGQEWLRDSLQRSSLSPQAGLVRIFFKLCYEERQEDAAQTPGRDENGDGENLKELFVIKDFYNHVNLQACHIPSQEAIMERIRALLPSTGGWVQPATIHFLPA